jgi:hypothetical protein
VWEGVYGLAGRLPDKPNADRQCWW